MQLTQQVFFETRAEGHATFFPYANEGLQQNIFVALPWRSYGHQRLFKQLLGHQWHCVQSGTGGRKGEEVAGHQY